jgi:diguanylate cyclase (GGDEF)-like protein
MLRDPFVGQAVLIAVPIAILAQGGAGRPQVVAALVATFVAGQAALAMTTRRIYARRRVSVSVGRLLVNVAFVASGRVVFGDAGNILALAYLPLVSVAASFGVRQALAVGAAAIALQGMVETLYRAEEGDALYRTLVFASVALLVGISTRLEVSRLHHARVRMREAVTDDRRRAKQIAGVESIGRILATDGPTDDALDRVVARVSSELGYRSVAIYLGGADRVVLGSQVGYHDLVEAFDGTRGIVGRVMRSGRPALVPDVKADPDYLEVDPDVQSEICVPLTAEGEFLGLVNVESTTHSLDTTDLRLMVAVADRLAAALIIGRERQRLTERADLFRHLHDFSEAVNGTLDPNELYRAIVRGVPRVVPADIAALVVLDRATGRYQLMAMDGVADEEYVGVEVRPGEGMAGRAIRDRALVIDEQFGRPSFAASVATAGDPALTPMQAAAVPLVREGAVVGAITVLRHDRERQFTQLERDALSMIAEQVALGVANAFLHADVRELAVRDPLTGLFNRRYLDPALEQLMAQRARLPEAERPALSVVMYDFDHFSDLNNRHGHQAGDAVLKTFGSMLLARKRSSDVVARFGGEEFAAVLYRATLDDALRIAEQVREQVASQPVEGPNGEELHVTVSAGCATAGPEAPTAEALLRAADVALYMAKRAGRNRVVAA